VKGEEGVVGEGEEVGVVLGEAVWELSATEEKHKSVQQHVMEDNLVGVVMCSRVLLVVG
jgi:hypothetical protein